MAKQKKCSLCKKVDLNYSLFSTYKFGQICVSCYSYKHLELSRKGYEERLARIAQKKIEAENQSFNNFIETGIVEPIKSN